MELCQYIDWEKENKGPNNSPDWGWNQKLFAESNYRSSHTQHVSILNVEMQSVSPSSIIQLYLGKPFAVQSTKGSKHCWNKRNLSFPRRKAALSLWVVSSWFVVAVAIDVVIVNDNDEPDEHNPNRSSRGPMDSTFPHAINLRRWENHILKKQPHVSSKIMKQLFCFCLLYKQSLETEACGQFRTKLKTKSTTSTPV